MSLPLPILDDRRWADLVEEGRALVPLYGPDWTDHNVHDPGIMLMELLAWVTEMDIFWLDQVPEKHKRKFLSLAGIVPRPPQPARALFQFELRDGSPPRPLPASFQIQAGAPGGQPIDFETMQPITIVPGRLAVIQREVDAQVVDLTGQWERGESLLAWGPDPKPGATFYLGLTESLPDYAPASLYFRLAGPRRDETERERIVEQEIRRATACPPPLTCQEAETGTETAAGQPPAFLAHHDVRLAWSYWSSPGRWQPLEAGDQLWDETRALTLNGRIVFSRNAHLFALPPGMEPKVEGPVPEDLRRRFAWEGVQLASDAFLGKGNGGAWTISDAANDRHYRLAREESTFVVYRRLPPMAKRALGEVEEPFYYLRCRIVHGAYDKSPELAYVALNGLVAEQATSVGQVTWPIAVDAQLPGEAPRSGAVRRLHFELDDRGRITKLQYAGHPAPRLRVLAFQAPTSQEGHLTLEALRIEPGGTGRPLQELTLPRPSALPDEFQMHTYEHGRWRSWEQRADFDASGRDDAHYLLDPTAGRVHFGDGERGRVVPPEAPILVAYRATRAADGNLRPGKATLRLANSLHNGALVDDVETLSGALQSITMPSGATGGRGAETVDEATGRALDYLERARRAVSVEDYRELAAETPGTRVARVAVKENHHPSFPCFVAPGVMTVLALPFLPAGRPFPSAGLRREIARYLDARRVIGTRIEVIGPTYVEVIVRARVRACAGVDTSALQRQIVAGLHRFFDPLPGGGPDGKGWPFGRDVYRSEVLQFLDEEQGVENVVSLELLSGDCRPSCSNVCVGPLGLVASGPHQIEVVS